RTRAEVESFMRHPPESDVRGYWVAEEDGAVAGFAQLAGDRESPVLRVQVLVHPDTRGRGHGTSVLERVTETAGGLGARELIGSPVTVAVAGRGEVAACAGLGVSRGRGRSADTEDTAVGAAHRGRGLGRWVKFESLQRLRADRPEVELVTTDNAEQNESMLNL